MLTNSFKIQVTFFYIFSRAYLGSEINMQINFAHQMEIWDFEIDTYVI